MSTLSASRRGLAFCATINIGNTKAIAATIPKSGRDATSQPIAGN